MPRSKEDIPVYNSKEKILEDILALNEILSREPNDLCTNYNKALKLIEFGEIEDSEVSYKQAVICLNKILTISNPNFSETSAAENELYPSHSLSGIGMVLSHFSTLQNQLDEGKTRENAFKYLREEQLPNLINVSFLRNLALQKLDNIKFQSLDYELEKLAIKQKPISFKSIVEVVQNKNYHKLKKLFKKYNLSESGLFTVDQWKGLLNIAAANCDLEIIYLLVKEGININLINKQYLVSLIEKSTVDNIESDYKENEVIDDLFSHKDLDNEDWRILYNNAAKEEELQIVEFYTEHKHISLMDKNNLFNLLSHIRDKDDFKMLSKHQVAKEKSEDWIKAVNEALNKICIQHVPDLQLIASMLNEDADPLYKNYKGRTIFDLAIRRPELRKFLVNYYSLFEIESDDKNEDIYLKMITTLLYEVKRGVNWDEYPCYQLRSFLTECKDLEKLQGLSPNDGIDKKEEVTAHLKIYLEKKEKRNKDFYGSYLSENSDDDIEDDIELDDSEKNKIREYITTARNNRKFDDRLRELKNDGLPGDVKIDQYLSNAKFKQSDRQIISHSANINKSKTNKVLDKLNKFIKEGMSIKSASEMIKIEDGYEFYIAQYRGIHYNVTKFGQATRRLHRELDEIGKPQYSQSVLFGASKKRNFDELYKSTEEEKLVFEKNYKKWAEALHQRLTKARSTGSYIYKRQSNNTEYSYDNLLDLMQDVYTKDYHKFLEQLKDSNILKEYLLNEYMPFISTGDVPYHALKYAYGTKYYGGYKDDRLRPRWNKDGVAERPYSGKVYVSIHPIVDYEEVNHLNSMNAMGKIKPEEEIISEKETTFLGYMPEDRIVYHYKAKYPSFKGEYKAAYLEKYGLFEDDYKLHKEVLSKLSPHSSKMKAFKDMLGEYLCCYHEVRLIDFARLETKKKGGILIYRGQDGLFQLKNPSHTPFSKKTVNIDVDEKKQHDKTKKARNYRSDLGQEALKLQDYTIYQNPTNDRKSTPNNSLRSTKFRKYIKAGNLFKLERALIPDHYLHNIFEYDDRSYSTALHLAVRHQKIEMVEYLIKKGANINCRDSDGNTPLHFAIKRKNKPLIQLFIKHNAEINIPNNENEAAEELILKTTPEWKNLLLSNVQKDEMIDEKTNEFETANNFFIKEIDRLKNKRKYDRALEYLEKYQQQFSNKAKKMFEEKKQEIITLKAEDINDPMANSLSKNRFF